MGMKIVKTTVAVLFSALMAFLVPLRADASNAESTWIGPADSSEGSMFVDSSWSPEGRPINLLIFNSGSIAKTALIDKKAKFYGEEWLEWGAYARIGDNNVNAFFGEGTTNCVVWRSVKGEKESAAENGLDLIGGIHVASVDDTCIAGALRIEGGTHNVGSEWNYGVNVGEKGDGYLELRTGTIVSYGDINVSGAYDGSLVVGSGAQGTEPALLSIDPASEKWIRVTNSEGGTGNLVIKAGGTVAAKHLHSNSAADSRLVLDGGTLEHNAACADGTGFLSDGLDIRITANGGTIRADVETEIAGDILDDDQASASKGTLFKTGNADLRLAGSTSRTGSTEVREGRLVLKAGIQLGANLTISEGCALVIDLANADKMEYDLFTGGAGIHLPESAVFTNYVYAINGEAFNGAITQGEGGNVHVSLSVKPEAAVAVIVADGAEDEYRASVSAALAAADSGKTVRLLRDAVLNEDAVARAGTVFDLNGFKITRRDDGVSLQLEGGAVVSNGTFATDVVYSEGGDTLFAISNNVSVSMADVNVGDLGGYEPYCALSAVDGATFEIDGGTWRAATLFASTNNNGHLEIKDGRFFIRAWQRDWEKGGTISISGGRFSLAPRRGDVKDGYVVMHIPADVELPYQVVPASSALYTQDGWMFSYADEQTAMGAVVAKVGERVFTTVSDAVRAASAGDTVTMVADVTILPEQIAIYKNLTIEGDAHLVKVRSPYVDGSGYVTADFTQEFDSVVYVSPDSDVTIRNLHVMGGGVIRGDYDNAGRYGIVNDGVLLLDDVTVTRSNGAVYNRVGGRMRMEDCRIVRNCRHSAGGFYNHGFAVMNRTSLSENRSLNDYGGGGACENGGELYVNNCVICNNSSTEIGGAINNFSTLAGHPRLYMMNTTVSGNFCATSIGYHNGGGIGVRAFNQPGTFYSLNNLICCNYRVELMDDTIGLSDVAILENSLLEDGMTNKLYYTVFDDGGMIREPGTVDKSVYVNEHAVALSSEDALGVFHGYYASPRVYQNAKTTAMDVKGALLVAKDDGSYASELARYAPIVNAASNRAVLGHDGVYTYFDASEWKSGVVRMSYAPVAGEVEIGSLSAAGEMVSFANLPSAGADCMVTNFYESASGRSFGIAGASGWIEEEKVYYTVKLAGEVTGGKVTGITLFGDSYESGTEITLTATPGYARSFLGWFEGDAETPVSTASVWTFQVLADRVLQPRFSEPSEVITARVAVHQASADATEDFPINVTLAWMTAHYEDFIATIEALGSVEAKEAKIKELLGQRDETTGWTMWQDYILGVEPGDPNAKLWIDSPQYRAVGREVIRFKMNELTPVDGSGFQIRYRLDAKSFGAESFARGETNDSGVFDVATAEDPSGLYVIDLLFIPDGYLTSEEYVTTVNTAGALRVATDDPCAIVAVPWTALSPSGQNPIAAGNLIRTMNLTTGDKLHVYDKANARYRSWQLRDNGQWEALGTYLLSSDGQVSWESAGKPEATTVPRGSGAWLERQNAEPHVYLVGQYDASEVETQLSGGWNLVGSPTTSAFNLADIVPQEGDGIVVSTAAEPRNMTYADGNWGYIKNTVVEFAGRKFVKPVRVTDDSVIPAGVGFWYIRSEDAAGTATIDWVK